MKIPDINIQNECEKSLKEQVKIISTYIIMSNVTYIDDKQEISKRVWNAI